MTRAAARVVGIVLSLALASGVGAWPIRIDGAAHSNDEARAVAIDAAGDVYTTGYIDDAGRLFTIVKHDGPTGAELWRRWLPGATASYYDVGQAIRFDAAGHVVVTGLVTNPTTFFDMGVAELDPTNGAILWRNDVNGFGPGVLANDSGSDLTIDANGDVIAVGAMQQGANFLDTDMAIVKLSGVDGAEQWRRLIAGTSAMGEFFITVATDAAGDVFAGGWYANVHGAEPWQYDAVLVKVDGTTGIEKWRWETTPLGSDYFAIVDEVVVGADGNPVVVGYTDNIGTYNDMVVAKLDGATGAEIWRVDGMVPGPHYDTAHTVALDANGDVLVGGTANASGAYYDPTVLKLSGVDGSELWRQTVPGGPGTVCPCTESATDVAVDPSGDVLVTTDTDGSIRLVKLSGPSGTVLWQRPVFTRPGTYSFPFGLALDAAGNAAAAGYVQTLFESNTNDWAVVKVSGADGHVLGCGNGTPDPGEACDDGNLVDGDGCESDCSPSCGNGRVDVAAAEQCDDGNAASGDGCEPTCRLTMCAGGVAIGRARLTMDPARGAVSLKGELGFADGAPAAYPPSGTGVQLLIEDRGSGDALVYDLTRATHAVPVLAAGGCGAGDGWTVRRAVARYRNLSNAIDPPACTAESANGLAKIAFVDHRARGRGVQVTAKTRHGAFAAPAGPVRVTVVLGGEAESMSGACAVHDFAPGACVHDGAKLVCR